MITLIVNIDVEPTHMVAFGRACMVASIRALEYEKHCLTFISQGDPNKENGWILIETYTNQHALDFHKTTQHFLEWRDTVKDMGTRVVTRLNH